MSLMELFTDPSTFDTLSMGEKVIGSLVTAMLGMGTTFTVLVLIWGFIALIGRIVRKEEKMFHHEEKPAPAVAPTPATAPAPAQADADATLVAVIMAAIAASQGTAVANNLIVRKIRRIPGPDSVWSNTGRHECLDSRRV
jgi:glutaconyl-CoA/methylmalonyl-CoA decarboxylase subunit delta